MRNLLLLLFGIVLLCINANAQSPESIPYQAVARDTNGTPIPNQAMRLRMSIRESSSSGTVVYKETDSVTTDKLGMFTVNVGSGTVVTGTFTGINWASGTKFLQVELDPAGGTTYTDMGASQILSTPFSLYSLSSGNIGTVPAKRIPYGGSSGFSSDANFTRDGTNGNTNIKAVKAGKYYSLNLGDSNQIDPGVGLLNIPSAVISYGDTAGSFKVNIGVGQIPDYGINEVAFLNLSDSSGNTAAIDFVRQEYNEMPTLLMSATRGGMEKGSNVIMEPDNMMLFWGGDDSVKNGHGLGFNDSYFTIYAGDGDSVYHWNWPNTEGSSGNPLVTDGLGNLSFAPISGSATALGAHNIDAGNGLSSDTINVTNNKNNIYNPSSAVSALLVHLPSSPNDGDVFMLTFAQNITAITYTNGTVGNSAWTSASSGGQKVYTYDSGTTTWY